MPKSPPETPSLRERLKDETRQIILDAFAELLSRTEIDRVTFAEIAASAGVGERTVYRHFPTREDLLRGLYGALSDKTAEAPFPMKEEADLTRHLLSYFASFDANAAVMKSAVITPQGYEMRMANRDERNAGFLKALDAACPGLSDEDRRFAAGAIQHMHSASAWLALREGWGLSGPRAAAASAWAIRAMIRDIKRRKGKPLKTDE